MVSCTDVAECGSRMIDFSGQDGLVGINKVGKTQSGASELVHFVRINPSNVVQNHLSRVLISLTTRKANSDLMKSSLNLLGDTV